MHDVPPPDLSALHGQEHTRRALEVAAAGAHSIVISGPPGCGKTTFITALQGFLPPGTKVVHLDPLRADWPAQVERAPASGPLTLLAVETRPCPCGHHVPDQFALAPCHCSPRTVVRHLRRVYTPIRDLVDLFVTAHELRMHDLTPWRRPEASAPVAARVQRARALQDARLGPGRTNTTLTPEEIRRHCSLGEGSTALLRTAVSRLYFTGRDHAAVQSLPTRLDDRVHRSSRSRGPHPGYTGPARFPCTPAPTRP